MPGALAYKYTSRFIFKPPPNSQKKKNLRLSFALAAITHVQIYIKRKRPRKRLRAAGNKRKSEPIHYTRGEQNRNCNRAT